MMVRRLVTKVALFLVLVLGFNSIEAYATTETTSALDSGFLTYKNPDYNIQMEYPANWNKSELNLAPYQVAFFYPTELREGLFESLLMPNVPPVSFVIQVLPRTSVNINESALRSLSSFEGNNQSRLVDHNHTILSGLPAYEEVHYIYANDESRKALDIWALGGNDSYSLRYHTEPGYFNQYLPDAKRMIDSFQITDENSSSSANTNKTKD